MAKRKPAKTGKKSHKAVRAPAATNHAFEDVPEEQWDALAESVAAIDGGVGPLDDMDDEDDDEEDVMGDGD